MPRQTEIRIRRGTAAEWTSANPTLSQGEMGWETDTRKIKVGDGSTAWNSLQYVRMDGGDLESGGGSPSPTSTPPAPTSTPPAPTSTPQAGAFSLSGAGFASANGCYVASGTYGGQTAYTNGTCWVGWGGSEWYLYQSSLGGGYAYIGFGASPAEEVLFWLAPSGLVEPAPSQSLGC